MEKWRNGSVAWTLCWSGAKTESVSENYRFLAHPMGSCAAAAAAAIARTDDRRPTTDDRRDRPVRATQTVYFVSHPAFPPDHAYSDSNPLRLRRARLPPAAAAARRRPLRSFVGFQELVNKGRTENHVFSG